MEDWNEDNLGDFLDDIDDLDALDDIDSVDEDATVGHHAARRLAHHFLNQRWLCSALCPPLSRIAAEASARSFMTIDDIVQHEAAMGLGGTK
jgi:hypothetical protein